MMMMMTKMLMVNGDDDNTKGGFSWTPGDQRWVWFGSRWKWGSLRSSEEHAWMGCQQWSCSVWPLASSEYHVVRGVIIIPNNTDHTMMTTTSSQCRHHQPRLEWEQQRASNDQEGDGGSTTAQVDTYPSTSLSHCSPCNTILYHFAFPLRLDRSAIWVHIATALKLESSFRVTKAHGVEDGQLLQKLFV